MKSKVFALLSASVLLLPLAACGGSEPAASPSPAESPAMSPAMSPSGSPAMSPKSPSPAATKSP